MRLSHDLLLESKFARNSVLNDVGSDRILAILNQVKSTELINYDDIFVATTQMVAGYFGLSEDALQVSYKRNRQEYGEDVKLLRGKALKDVADTVSVTNLNSKIRHVLVWTPRAILRFAWQSTESEIARQVRDASILAIETSESGRERLERQLLTSNNDELERLRSRITELEAKLVETEQIAFPHTLEELHEVSGIVNKSYIKSVLKDFFTHGTEYLEVDGKIVLSESTYNTLVASFRSARGTDISHLPRIIKLVTIQYFRFQYGRKKNSRLAKRESPGQLSIPGLES